MSCLNVKSPDYIILKKDAENSNRSLLDLYINANVYNNYFDKIPRTIKELDEGLEFIKYHHYLTDAVKDMIMLDSPAVTQNPNKSNVFEFRVVEGSTMINTRDRAYATAKRLTDKINNEYVSENQKPLARLSDNDGIIKIILEPSSSVINSYMNNSKLANEQDRLEYENELNQDPYMDEMRARLEFQKLIDKGEIKQTCKIG